MSININTKLFSLDTVYSTFTYSETFSMLNNLTEVRLELEEEMDRILLNFEMDDEKVSKLVEDLETQLNYLNKNIEHLKMPYCAMNPRYLKLELC